MSESKVIKIKPGEQLTIIADEWYNNSPETPQAGQYLSSAKGNLRYKVGLVSDIHFDAEDSHNSEYAKDFINAINYFRCAGVDFMCNAGDICQYNDNDLKLYNEYYTNYAWAPTNAGLRSFTSLGNHDYLRLFS